MSSASWELQKAVHAALSANPALTGLLGGSRVYDDVPRGVEFPYVTLGESTVRDWSTGSEDGQEHVLSITVWSRATGEREVNQIMAVIRDALHDVALTVAGHRLINLRQDFSDARRDADGETYRGLLRYRAVTEPAP
jgi:Protein of unknown function (DUF3168)